MKPVQPYLAIMIATLLLSALLAACSNSSDSSNPTAQPSNSTNEPKQADEPEPSVDQPEAAAYPRTVKDANGDFTIEEKPQKIALAHWGLSETLLTFDLDHAALTLPFTKDQSLLGSEQYKPYVDKIGAIEIIGENTEVNLEALLEYEPDLILAGSDTNKAIAAELQKIAPTYFLDEAAVNVWGDWPTVMRLFGELLAQEAQAESYIERFETLKTDAKHRLADVEGTTALLQVRKDAVWLQGPAYAELYYSGLGLTPPSGTLAEEGGQLSLEGLSELDPDYLLLGNFSVGDSSQPAEIEAWKDSPVWANLKAVKQQRVYAFDGQLALGYGPIGQTYGIEQVLAAMD